MRVNAESKCCWVQLACTYGPVCKTQHNTSYKQLDPTDTPSVTEHDTDAQYHTQRFVHDFVSLITNLELLVLVLEVLQKD